MKECYYYLDSTPTHSYMKALYKYPQRAYPYADLVDENRRRGHGDPEYELADTGIFTDGRYFDVTAEYAKARRTTSAFASRWRTAAPMRRRCICCPRSGIATRGRGAATASAFTRSRR